MYFGEIHSVFLTYKDLLFYLILSYYYNCRHISRKTKVYVKEIKPAKYLFVFIRFFRKWNPDNAYNQ